jgi:recombination protein RecA
LDLRWATTAGVNLSRLVLCRPESGEQALQVASVLVGCGAVEVLVIDSIAALVPKAELAADIGERIPRGPGESAQPGPAPALRADRPG